MNREDLAVGELYRIQKSAEPVTVTAIPEKGDITIIDAAGTTRTIALATIIEPHIAAERREGLIPKLRPYRIRVEEALAAHGAYVRPISKRCSFTITFLQPGADVFDAFPPTAKFELLALRRGVPSPTYQANIAAVQAIHPWVKSRADRYQQQVFVDIPPDIARDLLDGITLSNIIAVRAPALDLVRHLGLLETPDTGSDVSLSDALFGD